MSNRLEFEDSPYLQQHKNNPVDWYPWGDEAFQKASNEKKPIFLSIGYSSCHWCHVMERESFENETIAQLLNSGFISIKLDREERPDLDKHYQDLYYLVHKKGGGWPLSVFLTHDKKPFHIATYIPPHNKYGGIGMVELLPLISKKYLDEFETLYISAEKIDRISQTLAPKEHREIDNNFIDRYVTSIERDFDFEYGGFGTAPKFPSFATLNTLSTLKKREMVDISLNKMVLGGFYDLVDGGFCRYSVDREWLVPHFEKMTYDNGLLLQLYSNSYITTKRESYKRISLEVAQFLVKNMSEKNLFFSASDADSNGVEGEYFTYSFDEVQDKIDFLTLSKLSITENGNFDGKSIVRTDKPENFKKEIEILKDIRSQRDYPFIDRKIILSWNAMAIKGFFRASLIDNKYLEVAENSLKALIDELFLYGKLYHSKLIDKDAKIEAFFEDYAYLIDTLLEAYSRTFKIEYLQQAKEFIDFTIENFYRDNRWFISLYEDFVTEAEIEDSSYPSALAKMINSLLTASVLLENMDMFSLAEKTLEFSYGIYLKYPPAFSTLTEALFRYKKEVLVVKSSVENLNKLNMETPLTLHKANDSEIYEVCGVGKCYKSFKSAFEVEQFLKDFHS